MKKWKKKKTEKKKEGDAEASRGKSERIRWAANHHQRN